MNSNRQENQKALLALTLTYTSLILILLLTLLCGLVWGTNETPLKLPKAEGSKSFDLEIDITNRSGINEYKKGEYQKAMENFKKAVNLAKRLRDPSRGILYYNLALSLHHLANHEEAFKQFYTARQYARGNQKILNSKLLKMHECGLNPSVTCDGKVPLPMNIEGSH
jgi:tetratricopeptide (TPR) repeat protein